MSVIPYVGLRFQNATKWITPCSNWCELDGSIHIFMTWVIQFWIQHSDSSVQAGFLKKNRSESEMGVNVTGY